MAKHFRVQVDDPGELDFIREAAMDEGLEVIEPGDGADYGPEAIDPVQPSWLLVGSSWWRGSWSP